jgi:heme-degrading monooxygenase HmoA
MFAVIFEVDPKPERWDAYLGYAGMLRPELEQIDGFVENERFSSLRRKGWLLSLSIWRDEDAVIRWRSHARHREVQQKGRTEVFRDYHLQVGEIVPENRLPGGAALVTLWEAVLHGLPAKPDPEAVAARLGFCNTKVLEWDAFESIVQPGKFILLTSSRDAPAPAHGAPESGADVRQRRVRVIRDYGMFDRAEAPQYYPPVARE